MSPKRWTPATGWPLPFYTFLHKQLQQSNREKMYNTAYVASVIRHSNVKGNAMTNTTTTTIHPFNGLFSRTTWKPVPERYLNETRWWSLGAQWLQLDDVQAIIVIFFNSCQFCRIHSSFHWLPESLDYIVYHYGDMFYRSVCNASDGYCNSGRVASVHEQLQTDRVQSAIQHSSHRVFTAS